MAEEIEPLNPRRRLDIGPETYLPEDISEEKRARIMKVTSSKNTKNAMYSAIPLICLEEECPFASTCPLYRENLTIYGSPCPIEAAMVTQFANEYMEELGVDLDNLTEVSLIRDLVDQEVQYLRKTKLLAKESFIQNNVVAIDHRSGEVIMKPELHAAVELEDKLHKRKRDIRNQLLATREARAKAGQVDLNSAAAMADLMDKVREVNKEKERQLKLLSGTLYQDDYIEDAEIVDED